jgi:MFS family permease
MTKVTLPGFYLISMWHKRDEAQRRFSLFLNAVSIAAAFGGLLASAIGKMDGIRGYSAWRWIFILEGLLTCIVSIGAFFTVADFPEHATFLNKDERAYVVERLAADQGRSGLEVRITLSAVIETFKDWKLIPGGLMYFGVTVSGYGEDCTARYHFH